MSVFRLAALPASEGDCLLLSYGPDEDHLRHVLVDGGRRATSEKLKEYLRSLGVKTIELLVVTHIDADHIEGTLELLENNNGEFTFEDVWFNGYKHLTEGLQAHGVVQGERLTAALQNLPWNKAADGKAVRLSDDDLPRVMPELAGGLKLTVLSPSLKKLRALEPVWEKTCREEGLVPGVPAREEEVPPGLEMFGNDLKEWAAVPSKKDTSKPNGTSIALIAEYGGKSVLLAADAHPDLLFASLEKLNGGEPIDFALVKVPHHGSNANVTSELLKALSSKRFLISTDGSKFRHPDKAAIARIITEMDPGIALMFNYEHNEATLWNKYAAEYGYTCRHRSDDEPALVVEI